MKKLSICLALVLFGSLSAFAQNTHSVSLTWTASADAAANPTLTYNVYRLNGACPATAPTSIGSSGFTKLNTAAVATTAYTDPALAPGTYCYFASAFVNTTESNPSNDAQGLIQPHPPSSLGITTITKYFNGGESQATWREDRRHSVPGRMVQVIVPA